MGDGAVVYVIQQKASKQIVKLAYRVDGGRLVTNQPSDPREERTRFLFDAAGNLILEYAESKVWFARVQC